jgi:hypothetical protein
MSPHKENFVWSLFLSESELALLDAIRNGGVEE